MESSLSGWTDLELDRSEVAKEEPLEAEANEKARADGEVAENLRWADGTVAQSKRRQRKREMALEPLL